MSGAIRARATTTMIALLVVMGAACAKSGSTAGGGGSAATSPPAAATGAVSGSGGGNPDYGGYGPKGRYGGGSGTTGKAGAGTIRQGVGGFAFSPATFTVKRGQSITVQNIGQVPHTFTIENKGVDVVNDPGQSKTVKIDLAPGTYEFICRFHASLGMRGVLTVTG